MGLEGSFSRGLEGGLEKGFKGDLGVSFFSKGALSPFSSPLEHQWSLALEVALHNGRASNDRPSITNPRQSSVPRSAIETTRLKIQRKGLHPKAIHQRMGPKGKEPPSASTKSSPPEQLPRPIAKFLVLQESTCSEEAALSRRTRRPRGTRKTRQFSVKLSTCILATLKTRPPATSGKPVPWLSQLLCFGCLQMPAEERHHKLTNDHLNAAAFVNAFLQYGALPLVGARTRQDSARASWVDEMETDDPASIHGLCAHFGRVSQSEAALAQHRTEVLRRWMLRGQELEPQERKLHRSMPEHLSAVLEGKKLLVFEEMLVASGYGDTSTASENPSWNLLQCRRSACTRLLPQCALGFYKPQSAHAPLSLLRRCTTSLRRRSPKDGSLGQCLLEQLSATCSVSRRFGVRPLDNLSESFINSTVLRTESIQPHGLDVVCAGIAYRLRARERFGLASVPVSFRGTSREPQGLWASHTAQRTEQARSTLFTLLFFSSPGLEPNPARLEASVHSSLDLKHFTAGEH